MIASTPAAADTLLAPAQFKAALWADPRRAVHAVAMGARIPDLAARLAAANVVDHECLRPGALTPEQQRVAAYMVPLERDAAITHWLLCEAAALEAFMGPMQSIVVPRAGGIATAELELGRLQWRRARLAATDG